MSLFQAIRGWPAGVAIFAALAVYLASQILGLSVAAAVFALVIALEIKRLAGSALARKLSKLWPQVFDACYSGQIAGLNFGEQISDLTRSAPVEFRKGFEALRNDLDQVGAQVALRNFRNHHQSREADLFAMLLELDLELGNRGQREAWRLAAAEMRASLKIAGEVAAKQGWVVGSAKLAIAAPWLVALMLMQLGNNREVFASALGSLVLLGGLGLSVLGYFLVSALGRLPSQPRVFHAA